MAKTFFEMMRENPAMVLTMLEEEDLICEDDYHHSYSPGWGNDDEGEDLDDFIEFD